MAARGEVSGVQGVATHLPYDKEDERGAQHQGEHVAEGREGERHGCASQPDDRGGLRGQKGTSPLCSLPLVRLLPTLPPAAALPLPPTDRPKTTSWVLRVSRPGG